MDRLIFKLSVAVCAKKTETRNEFKKCKAGQTRGFFCFDKIDKTN